MEYQQIIVGLGNPGQEYEHTRHNVGFAALDTIAKQYGTTEKSEPLFSRKKDVLFAETEIHGKLVLLIKPVAYMNKSGTALKQFFAYRNISTADLLSRLVVISDDSDLTEGSVKILYNRGSGGHKGIEDIKKSLGSIEFTRIKIGIRPEGNTKKSETFVLTNFGSESPIGKIIQQTPEIISVLIEKGLAHCQSQFSSLKIVHEP